MATISIGVEIRFLLAALVVWRLSHMLSYEDGPWDVFLDLRIWAGAKPETHLYPDGKQTLVWQAFTFWGKLLLCPLCLSMWVSAPLAVWVAGVCWEAAVVWLALSGAASLAELIANRS